MATKKLREPWTQDVSAPQAEPGAANLIIPRRAVLTGSALVLAGSASGCCWGQDTPLRTQFMADFTKAFIGDPTTIPAPAPPPANDKWPDPHRLWPQTGQARDAIAADYGTFLNVLLSVAFVGGPPPTFPAGSLGDRIVQFLQAQNWPNGTPIPSQYSQERGTVNLVEIAVISDRLLQAINSFGPGSGGGGGGWPPH